MPKINTHKSERLIGTVRGHIALYDPAHKDYSDFGVKARLWNEVAVKCGIRTGQEAKMMWKNLRDCYRICRNKLHYNPKTRVWKFYKHMDFLAPYIKDRKFRGRTPQSIPVILENVDVESGESGGPDGSLDINETQGEFTTIQYWNDSEPGLVTTEVEPKVTKNLDLTGEDESGLESPHDSDHESYEDVLPEALNNGTVDSSLKMFFDAMYASTSQLPQSLQRSVKNKLFAAVLEAEEEAEKMKMPASARVQVKTEH